MSRKPSRSPSTARSAHLISVRSTAAPSHSSPALASTPR
jgi:hypothetical protein